MLASSASANNALYYFFGIKFETIKFIKYILMKSPLTTGLRKQKPINK